MDIVPIKKKPNFNTDNGFGFETIDYMGFKINVVTTMGNVLVKAKTVVSSGESKQLYECSGINEDRDEAIRDCLNSAKSILWNECERFS